MNQDAKKTYKILLLGDSTVGKTCFLLRFTENTFQEIHMSTIGLDYRVKDVKLENGETITAQIWDTAGQERFRNITKNYYKGANGILLVFDITFKKSFDNVENWISQINDAASKKAIMYLIGNKIDDKYNRKITTEQAEELAKANNIKYFETSAKANINVEESFMSLINEIHEKLGNEDIIPQGRKISIDEKKKEGGCC